MAVYRDVVESGGSPVPGASVTIYTEQPSVAIGSESSVTFTKATIYSERTLVTTKTNPITTDSNGNFEFFMATGSLVAIYTVKTGYGAVWQRNVDVTGTDPA